MPRRHIPKEYKEIAFYMSLQEDVDDNGIRRFTGISERSMRHLRKTYNETGEVVRTPVCPGRPRILYYYDLMFTGCDA